MPSQMWVGSGFIGPHGGIRFDLSPRGCLFFEIKGALPIDHILTIKLVRAFKLSICISARFRKNIHLLGALNPFIDIPSVIPSTIFTLIIFSI